jgi:hypothetical chaperone protein
MTNAVIGIDFGTTNSSVARAGAGGEVQLATFPSLGGMTDAYRSLLYLEQVKEHGTNSVKSWTGPAGIEEYLAADTKGRLIQSLKSFLSSRTLTTTDVFGRRHKLESLIARILKDLREKAEIQFGSAIRSAVVGRPVQFVGANNDEDNAYAEARLRESFRAAGFESVEFELEPVAAAHYYESTLDHDELILIGDFGGGTSDFSLVHVGPTIRKRGRTPSDLLGNSGVGLAGDAFDAKIVRHLVSPALGAGSQFRSPTGDGDKIMPVPSWVYAKLERWHHLSLLKGREVMSMLHDLHIHALEPKKIAALMYLVRNDLGYHLHRAVQQVKCDLSTGSTATFRFDDGPIEIEAKVKRASFEQWISEELHQIESCIDSLLLSSGLKPKQVDRVFLTGGSSFVPAVRRIFELRFGVARIRSGNEFTSVARGLALKAAEASAV